MNYERLWYKLKDAAIRSTDTSLVKTMDRLEIDMVQRDGVTEVRLGELTVVDRVEALNTYLNEFRKGIEQYKKASRLSRW